MRDQKDANPVGSREGVAPEAALPRKMGDIDGRQGIVSEDFQTLTGRQAAERRFHPDDGKRAAEASGVKGHF